MKPSLKHIEKIKDVRYEFYHENVTKEDDNREQVEGMVDGQSPVAKGVLLIAWVHAAPVQNILKLLVRSDGNQA